MDHPIKIKVSSGKMMNSYVIDLKVKLRSEKKKGK